MTFNEWWEAPGDTSTDVPQPSCPKHSTGYMTACAFCTADLNAAMKYVAKEAYAAGREQGVKEGMEANLPSWSELEKYTNIRRWLWVTFGTSVGVILSGFYFALRKVL